MIGHDPAFPFIYQRFPFAAEQEFVQGILEVLAAHLGTPSTCPSQCCLVHQVFQVGSREAVSYPGQVLQVHIRR